MCIRDSLRLLSRDHETLVDAVGGVTNAREVVADLSVLFEVDAVELRLRSDTDLHERLDEVTDQEGHDRGVDQDGEGADRLLAELIEAASVDEAVDAAGSGVTGQEADEQGPRKTTDQVDAHDVERVVVAELELQADCQRTHDARDGTNDDRTDRGHRRTCLLYTS